MHTPTGLIEINITDQFERRREIRQSIMYRTGRDAKNTPYTAKEFEFHYGREPNTVSEQLPTKQKKGSKGVGNYQFISMKKVTKLKFNSASSDKILVAMSSSEHTVTTKAIEFYIEIT